MHHFQFIWMVCVYQSDFNEFIIFESYRIIIMSFGIVVCCML
jgi:hypothetical protein